MKKEELKNIIDKIFESIFNKECPYTIEELKSKFAFDIRLPVEVRDTTTNELTYASSIENHKFITNENMMKKDEEEGWMLPKQNVRSLKEVIKIWKIINYTTTERVYDSEFVEKSDPIYRCRYVYHSTDCGDSNYLMFCDGIHESNYVIAGERSATIGYSLRVSDSNTVTNSYQVVCSSHISNSLFIQDCSNLFECIFCSHISSKEYCIANMQFTKEEYYYLKEEIIKWILTN